MADCLFCSIVEGAIPNHTVYEDEHCLAFLDIYPRSKGHTVVIPKKHATTILDLDEESAAAFMPAVQKSMQRIADVLAPEGFSVGANQGEAGGQEIMHLHMHIMPRWKGDGGGNMHSIVKAESDMPVEDVAKLFS